MNKGAVFLGVVSLAAAGGYYAYDQGWFAKKKDDAGVASEEKHGDEGRKPTVVKQLTMPDLIGVGEADARRRVKSAGFPADAVTVLTDKGCGSSDENMQPEGNVCAQDPSAGASVNDRQKIDIVIEHDTFEHGAVGYATEWHRMPDLVGSSLADAQATLQAKGFGPDEFEIRNVSSSSACLPDYVCDTTPGGGKRKPKGMQGYLTVGLRDKGH